MNLFYRNKPINIIKDLPAVNNDPLINYEKIHRNNISKPTFKLETITMNELKIHMKNMKTSKSAGVDTITMKTIKMFQKTMEPALLNIVNTSILTNTFPNSLKISKILPNLKP